VDDEDNTDDDASDEAITLEDALLSADELLGADADNELEEAAPPGEEDELPQATNKLLNPTTKTRE
jgi:hypothetical protein